MNEQDENEANANKIYKGRSVENGQPAFEREMKLVNSNMESGDAWSVLTVKRLVFHECCLKGDCFYNNVNMLFLLVY